MSVEKQEENQIQETGQPPKVEVNLQFHWYFLAFFIIYAGSFVIPGLIFMFFSYFYFVPVFLETNSFLALFTELEPLIAAILIPWVMIGCYLLHLILVGFITRWLWGITEKNSPSKEGVIPRNIPSKTLNYYHIRSFMIKYGKNTFVKGPFPYLTNWFFNTVRSNLIGKGTTIEEQVCGDKFCEIGKNCYFGPNAVLTTHLVEGVFGRVTYFKIRVGDNSTFSPISMVAPGGKLGDNTYLFPFVAAFKYSEIKGDNYYFGTPLRKIFGKKVMEYLGLTEEDMKKEEIQREKQKQAQDPGKIEKGEKNGSA